MNRTSAQVAALIGAIVAAQTTTGTANTGASGAAVSVGSVASTTLSGDDCE